MSISEKLTTIAENQQKVFDAGYNKGKSESSGDSEFWDIYQNNGNRKNYQFAFAGQGWTNENFKPNKDIIVTDSAYGMFWVSGIEGDLVEILKSLNITLDFSKAIQYQYVFNGSKFTRLGVINMTGSAALTYTFSSCTVLETIDKLILNAKGTNTFTSTFDGCTNLKNITIEGVIGNDIRFTQCTKLTKESLTSIIEHLSGSTSGKTLTLSKTAVKNAFGINVDDESTYPEGSEYYTLRHSKDNWTFNYV